MKFTSKQFLAVWEKVTRLARRLLARPWTSFSRPPKPFASEAPGRVGPWLGDWRQFHWVPLSESVHPTAQRLLVAVRRHEMVTLRYWGGGAPGTVRCVSPALVFQAGGHGPLYVAGYCHLRRQERVFRVERVELLTLDGDILSITE